MEEKREPRADDIQHKGNARAARDIDHVPILAPRSHRAAHGANW
jgi:hypothetical protein